MPDYRDSDFYKQLPKNTTASLPDAVVTLQDLNPFDIHNKNVASDVSDFGKRQPSEYPKTPFRYDTDFEKVRAENQSGWDQAGNMLGQVAVGIVGDLVSNAGALMDPTPLFNSDADFSNSVVEAGNSIVKKGEEWFPIFTEKQDGSVDWGDPGWWYTNGVGAIKMLSLIVTGRGIAGALGAIGKLAKAESLIGKTGLAMTTETLGAAAINHMIGFQTSGEIYKSTYEQGIQLGKSDDESKSIAAEAAALNYRANLANTALTLGTLMSVSKGMRFLGTRNPTGLLPEELAAGEATAFKYAEEAAIKGVNPVSKFFNKNIHYQGQINAGLWMASGIIAQKEATRRANILLGIEKDDKSDFTTRLTRDYLPSGEIWNSLGWGIAAGIAFGSIMKVANNKMTSGDENYQTRLQYKLQEVENRKATLDYIGAVLKDAHAKGDNKTVDDALYQYGSTMIQDALRAGNGDLLLAMAKDPKTIDQMEAMGVDRVDAQKTLSDISARYESLEKSFRKNLRYATSKGIKEEYSLATYLTSLDANKEMYERDYKNAERDIAKTLDNPLLKEERKKDSEFSVSFDDIIEYNSWKVLEEESNKRADELKSKVDSDKENPVKKSNYLSEIIKLNAINSNRKLIEERLKESLKGKLDEYSKKVDKLIPKEELKRFKDKNSSYASLIQTEKIKAELGTKEGLKRFEDEMAEMYNLGAKMKEAKVKTEAVKQKKEKEVADKAEVKETADAEKEIPIVKKQTVVQDTEIQSVQNFADRIMSGETLKSPEDLQYYENNKTEIEKILNDTLAKEEPISEEQVIPDSEMKELLSLFEQQTDSPPQDDDLSFEQEPKKSKSDLLRDIVLLGQKKAAEKKEIFTFGKMINMMRGFYGDEYMNKNYEGIKKTFIDLDPEHAYVKNLTLSDVVKGTPKVVADIIKSQERNVDQSVSVDNPTREEKYTVEEHIKNLQRETSDNTPNFKEDEYGRWRIACVDMASLSKLWEPVYDENGVEVGKKDVIVDGKAVEAIPEPEINSPNDFQHGDDIYIYIEPKEKLEGRSDALRKDPDTINIAISSKAEFEKANGDTHKMRTIAWVHEIKWIRENAHPDEVDRLVKETRAIRNAVLNSVDDKGKLTPIIAKITSTSFGHLTYQESERTIRDIISEDPDAFCGVGDQNGGYKHNKEGVNIINRDSLSGQLYIFLKTKVKNCFAAVLLKRNTLSKSPNFNKIVTNIAHLIHEYSQKRARTVGVTTIDGLRSEVNKYTFVYSKMAGENDNRRSIFFLHETEDGKLLLFFNPKGSDEAGLDIGKLPYEEIEVRIKDRLAEKNSNIVNEYFSGANKDFDVIEWNGTKLERNKKDYIDFISDNNFITSNIQRVNNAWFVQPTITYKITDVVKPNVTKTTVADDLRTMVLPGENIPPESVLRPKRDLKVLEAPIKQEKPDVSAELDFSTFNTLSNFLIEHSLQKQTDITSSITTGLLNALKSSKDISDAFELVKEDLRTNYEFFDSYASGKFPIDAEAIKDGAYSTTELNRIVADNIKHVLDNFEPNIEKNNNVGYRTLSEMVYDKLGFKIKSGDDIDETVKNGDPFADNNQRDPKSGMSSNIRKFLAFIPKTDGVNPKVNSIGLVQYHDYDQLYNQLQNLLSDIPINEMVGVLDAYSDKNPMFADVSRELIKYANKPEYNEFLTVFRKQEMVQKIALYVPSKSETGAPTIKVANSNSQGAHQVVINNWLENFKETGVQSGILKKVNEELIIDTAKGDIIYSEFKDWLVNNKGSKKYNFVTLSKIFNKIGVEITADDLAGFLRSVGNKPAYKVLERGKYKGSDKTFIDFARGEFGQIFKTLAGGEKKEILSEEPFENNNPWIDQFNRLKLIARQYLVNNPTEFSNSFRNGENNLVYSIVNPSFLPNKLYQYKNNLEYTKRVLSTDFASTSSWMKSPEKLNALELSYFDTLENQKSNADGKPYEKQNDIEGELTEVALYHNNGKDIAFYSYVTPSDKTTFPIIGNLREEVGKESFIDGKFDLDDKTINKLAEFAWGEIKRINTTASGKIDKKSQLDGVHNGLKSGLKFFLMPFLNDLTIRREDGGIEPTKENIKAIKDSIKDFYSKLILHKLNEWKEFGLINKDGSYKLDAKYVHKVSDKISKIEAKEGERKFDKNENLFNYLAADYVINKAIAYGNMFQMFVGDPAQFVKVSTTNASEVGINETIDNMFKRTAKDIAPGMEGKFMDDSFNILMVKEPINKSKISEYTDKIGKFMDSYSHIYGADSQSWCTTREYIENLYALGRLSTKEREDLLGKVNRQEDFTIKELGQIMQVLKPVYVQNVIHDGDVSTNRSYYIKTSVIPLISQLTRGLHIDNMRTWMEENRVNHIVVDSAVKAGRGDIISDVFGEDGSINIPKSAFNSIKTLPRDGYRIQLENPDKSDNLYMREGTQIRKLITANLPNTFRLKFSDKELNAFETSQQLDVFHNELYKRGQQKVHRELGVEQVNGAYRITNVNKLRNILIDEARKRDYDVNDLLALNTITDAYGNSSFEMPLWLHPASEKFESLLNSIINNRVLKITMPGMSLVQGANHGFSFNKSSITDEIKPEIGIHYVKGYDNSKPLSYNYNPEKGDVEAEVILPFRFFGRDGKALDVAKHIDKLDPQLLEMIGYRIPGQGQNSMIRLKVVGFLPELSGDLIIVPSEIVKQMGSDMDVDKLFVHYFEHKFDGKKITKIQADLSNSLESTKKRFISKVYKTYGRDFRDVINEGYDDAMTRSREMIEEAKKKYGDIESPHTLVTYIQNKLKEPSNVFSDINADFNRIGGKEELNPYTKLLMYADIIDKGLCKANLALSSLQDNQGTSEARLGRAKLDVEQYKALGIFVDSLIQQSEGYEATKKVLKSEVWDNYNFEQAQKLYAFAEQSNFDEFSKLPIEEQLSKEEVNNSIMDMYHGILRTKEVTPMILDPLSANSWREVGKSIEKATPIKEGFDDSKATSVSPLYGGLHRKVMVDNRSGKVGMGIASLSVTHHTLSQKAALYIKKVVDKKGVVKENISIPFLDKNGKLYEDEETGNTIHQTNLPYLNHSTEGAYRMDKIFGFADPETGEVKTILSVIQSLQSALVDIAKDGIPPKVGITARTLNVAMLIGRAGFNEKFIGWFLKQPIIEEYTKRLDRLGDITGTSFTKAKQIALENELFKEYGEVDNITAFSLDDLKDLYSNRTNDAEWKLKQAQILKNFIEWDKVSNKLIRFQNIVNIDTATLDKSIYSTVITKRDWDNYIDGGVKYFGNTDNFFLDTQQGGALKYAVKNSLEAFSGPHTFPYDSNLFQGITNDISNIMKQDFGLTEKDVYKINNGLKAGILGTIYGDASGIRQQLMFGKNSFAKQVTELKKHTDNLFLKKLQTNISTDGKSPDIVSYISSGKIDKDIKLNVELAWLELLKAPKGSLERKVGESAVIYAHLIDNKRTVGGLSSIIPIDYIKSSGIAKELSKVNFYRLDIKNEFGEIDDGILQSRFTRQYFQHNPYKTQEVKLITDKSTVGFGDVDVIESKKITTKKGKQVDEPTIIRVKYDVKNQSNDVHDNNEHGLQFIHILDSENNIVNLYELNSQDKTGFEYRRIDTLGNKYSNEYNFYSDDVHSIFNLDNVTPTRDLSKPVFVKKELPKENPEMVKYDMPQTFTDLNFHLGLKDVLTSIRDKGTTKYSPLATWFVDNYSKEIDETAFRVASNNDKYLMGNRGSYDWRSEDNVLTINKDSDSHINGYENTPATEVLQRTLLHEFTHRLIDKKIESPTTEKEIEIGRKIQVLLNKTKQYFEEHPDEVHPDVEMQEHWFGNRREFVAQTFSNPWMQEKLNSIKYKDATIWDKIVKLFSQLLGIDIKKDSMLSEVVGEVSKLLEKDKVSGDLTKELPLEDIKSTESKPSFEKEEPIDLLPLERKIFDGLGIKKSYQMSLSTAIKYKRIYDNKGQFGIDNKKYFLDYEPVYTTQIDKYKLVLKIRPDYIPPKESNQLSFSFEKEQNEKSKIKGVPVITEPTGIDKAVQNIQRIIKVLEPKVLKGGDKFAKYKTKIKNLKEQLSKIEDKPTNAVIRDIAINQVNEVTANLSSIEDRILSRGLTADGYADLIENLSENKAYLDGWEDINDYLGYKFGTDEWRIGEDIADRVNNLQKSYLDLLRASVLGYFSLETYKSDALPDLYTHEDIQGLAKTSPILSAKPDTGWGTLMLLDTSMSHNELVKMTDDMVRKQTFNIDSDWIKFMKDEFEPTLKIYKSLNKEQLKPLYQIGSDGKRTGNYTSEYRQEFYDRKREFWRDNKDWSKRNAWLRENADIITLKEIKEGKSERFSDDYIKEAKNLLDHYEEMKTSYGEYLLSTDRYKGVDDPKYHADLKKWETINNPYTKYNGRAIPKGWKGYDYIPDPQPKDKWKDKNYQTIQNNPKLKQIYDVLIRRVQENMDMMPMNKNRQRNYAPFLEKSLGQRLSENGYMSIVKSIPDWMKMAISEEIESHIDRRTFGGKEVPLKNVKSASEGELKDRSEDLMAAILSHTRTALSYKYYSKIATIGESALEILSQMKEVEPTTDNKEYKKNFFGYTKQTSNGLKNTQEHLRYMLDAMLYNEKRKTEGVYGNKMYTKEDKAKLADLELKLEKGEITQEAYKLASNRIGRYKTASKQVNTLMNYSYLQALGLNPFSAITNSFFGIISNFTHAAAGVDFTDRECFQGLGIALECITAGKKNILARSNTIQKVWSWAEQLNALGEANESVYGRNKTILDKVMFMQERSEWLNRITNLVAQLKHIKLKDINGKDVSIWDAYNVDKEGRLVWNETKMGKRGEEHVSKIVAEDGKTVNIYRLRRKVQHINDVLHGNYNAESPIKLKSKTIGVLIMMFRSWIPYNFVDRFGKEEFDPSLQRMVKGRYRSIFSAETVDGEHLGFKDIAKTMLKVLAFGGKNAYKNISETDVINLKKNLREMKILVGMVTTMLALNAIKQDDKDKVGRGTTIFALNAMQRLNGDITFFTNPSSVSQIMQSLVPALKTVQNFYKLVPAAYDLAVGDDTYKSGPFRGKSKFLKKAADAFPIINQPGRFNATISQVYNSNFMKR